MSKLLKRSKLNRDVSRGRNHERRRSERGEGENLTLTWRVWLQLDRFFEAAMYLKGNGNSLVRKQEEVETSHSGLF